MRFAYADPPYLGLASYYPEHPEAWRWDNIEAHADLLDDLARDFDGFVYHLHVPALAEILPICPEPYRVLAWIKPFTSWKNAWPAYCWEPVILWGGRASRGELETPRDFHSASMALARGLRGAKPPEVCRWLYRCLGALPGDELVDLFPGSGAAGEAWAAHQREQPLPFPDDLVKPNGQARGDAQQSLL